MKFTVPVNEPCFFGNERKYLLKCIKNGFISSVGQSVKEFERKFAKRLNRKFAISVSNGTGIKDNQSKLFTKRYRQSCNSKGLLDGEDISKLILFLLSDKSKYITGQNLVIDDGWSL